ncbi:3-deoxy-manno-octulosonate cytidylyltransferase [Haliovirga abyssi]|uniref:3-deoxy-manno-octulosonate cytidylyltransferase n=1 Tax=Haliovirga abyssi TaxID=2996794 RepID=A0AAU9DAF3_9FUSO|nr:3-deoxy-manno-octulosonate cytidylyltransferase [Haliovirga abyssi]BDU50320.1 3-deoxy-manno-octulosonate cytidylyltransferase [Haliovirga abyssi]
MKILGVIPARYGSSRFEGKPLALINGKTMIEWVYKRALKSNVDKLIVATDDMRIYDKVKEFGGDVMMTSNSHKTGTDRIIEVAKEWNEYDVIINIQGDEPLIEVEMINQLIVPFVENSKLKMATLKHEISNKNNIVNPNIVKVITDKNGYALYFSRTPIPYNRDKKDAKYYRHIGIYGYNRQFLLNYNNLEKSVLEEMESLEQLRALENGYKIKVETTNFDVRGVDTPEDLHEVERIIKIKGIKI